MKHTIRNISLIAGLSLFAHAALAADITLDISGYETDKGVTLIRVFDSQQAFESDDGEAIVSVIQRLTGESTVLTLHNMPAGEYAVSLFHDENGNRELDTNLVGIPTEQYGASNNAGRFGPPTFADAKFSVDGNVKVEITLR